MPTRKKQAPPVMTPEQFLSAYPVEIQILATELRDLIKQTIKVEEERVTFGWGLIGYRVASQHRTVFPCRIVPKPDRVDLAFENGVLMNDPGGFLEAMPNTTQIRYVPISKMADIQPEKLAPLILESVRVSVKKA